MLGLGPIKWLIGPITGAIMGGFIFSRIMEAFFGGAQGVVHDTIFRRRSAGDRSRRDDE